MFRKLFFRRDSAESVDQDSGEARVPRHEGGLSPGLLWLSAFLLSVLVTGAVGLLAYRQLEAQTGPLSEAVSKAQGDRVAAGINGRIQGLTAVVERAAAQPALAAVMAGGDPVAIAAKADAIAAAIPDALRVRLLPPGAGVPDETVSPRLGYAGIALARQAAAGTPPALELHWAGAPDQHIALARAIKAPQPPVAGVLLASIDPTALERWLASVLPEGGYAEVRQSADGHTLVAARGDAARKGTAPTGSVRLAGTAWELSYWLPPQAPPLSLETRVAFIAPFGAAVAVLALLFAILGVVDSRLVRTDLEHLVTHVFDLQDRKRAHGHTVRLREFRKAVERLDEQFQPPDVPSEAPREIAAPENPLFLREGTIQVEEVDGADPK